MTDKECELIAQARKKPISWGIYVLFIIRLGHWDDKTYARTFTPIVLVSVHKKNQASAYRLLLSLSNKLILFGSHY